MIELKNPMERIIFFSGGVNADSMKAVSEKIVAVNEDDKMMKKIYKKFGLTYKPKPIKIYIDSPGGLVYQVFGTVSVIESSKTPVYTYCTGAAMSCGFILLIAGHKRFCYKHGTPLYHQIGVFPDGRIQDASENLKQGEYIQKKLEKFTIEKTKITKKQLKKNRKRKKDWYMTAKEALKLHVVDKII